MTERTREVTGVILAGGSASRFSGKPKGLERVAGIRIIDRVATSLIAATDRLMVISNDAAASTWLPGAEVAADVLHGKASLLGIHSALSRAGTDVVVIAWDMPFVPATLVMELQRRLVGEVTAVVPIGAHGPEAVCAAYSRRVLPYIERLATEQRMKLGAAVRELPGARFISGDELASFGEESIMFFNVNSDADLARAEAIAGSA